MHGVARWMRVGLLLGMGLMPASMPASMPAWAVEPQAPDRLISAEEAVLIAIRSQIEQTRAPRNPTQFEKGDAIDRAGLAKFYSALGEQTDAEKRRPLWVTEGGLNAQARAAIEEIGKAGEWGLPADQFADLREGNGGAGGGQLRGRELIDLEMKMSLAILKYARYARGGRMDPTDLSLDIDRKPPLLPASDVLRGARDATNVGAFLQDLHPKHEQFVKLRAAYLKALDDEADVVEQTERDDRGEGGERKRRQISKKVLSKRLLYNMEMWRWMPENLGRLYVMPNIPEFRIRVVKDGQVIHSERIVTGKVQNKTPIFSDELETVVFRPNWGIPDSIKVKEVLPKIMRGQSIERQGFRVQYGGRDIDDRSIDWSRADIRNYHVYQPPGQRNALGLVKFLFPNKHAVYFHDTPSKYLFDKKARAYSHGCIRVRNPMQMAAVIFGEDRGWSRGKIDEIAESRVDDQQIALNRKIPVHVSYFTARANEDGEIELVDDVYGHERLVQLGFDGKAHTIVKEDRSLDKYLGDRVGRDDQVANYQDDERPRRSRDRQWMRNVWGHDN